MEPIEVINKRLKDYFGLFDTTGEQNWKVFWSEEYLEKRLVTETESGVQLLYPEAREVKKANYITDRYVLTKLVAVPEHNQKELCGAKISYEVIWTFENPATGEAIAPDWDMIVALITTIYSNMANAGKGPKYKEPETQQNTAEGCAYRADKLYQAMYGDESKISDALRMDTAVGFGVRQRKDWTH